MGLVRKVNHSMLPLAGGEVHGPLYRCLLEPMARDPMDSGVKMDSR
jgi:hypothetical protein